MSAGLADGFEESPAQGGGGDSLSLCCAFFCETTRTACRLHALVPTGCTFNRCDALGPHTRRSSPRFGCAPLQLALSPLCTQLPPSWCNRTTTTTACMARHVCEVVVAVLCLREASY